jgi:hypothetical protein
MEKLLNIKNLLLVSKPVCFLQSKHTLMIIIVCLLCKNSFAQSNLIPNGSFEVYSSCPPVGNSISYAVPWFQPNNPSSFPDGSSDYFNFCSGLDCFDFYQCPRTGMGMVGLQFFHPTPYSFINLDREYIEIEFLDSLKNGKKYCIRFFVNKANNSGMSGFPIKQIQAVLTSDSLIYNDSNGSYITGVIPIMEADSIITDTINWIPIEINFEAGGGEKFLTIGNFAPGNMVDYTIVGDTNASNNTLGYYFIDDVSIYEQPEIFAGNDTTLSLGDSIQLGLDGRPDILYSWNPTAGLSNPNIANPMASPGITTTYTLAVTDTNELACTSVFIDTVRVQVGPSEINEIQNNFSLTVYPNPFDEKVTFLANVSGQYEIRIIDIVGKRIFSDFFDGNEFVLKNVEINCGIYFYEVKNRNGEAFNGKFFKK